ncbi:TetR/AcrR family transcriptional regulator [Leucobacter soli]|uniref:TetR/AcrR family transcriptional regulator n=1 Tax=Leucobacter soli TaxID=2812850 RepID=UPI001C402C97|nr:TetR/AcrR family transcriptional regulator [Leucobacter soli]
MDIRQQRTRAQLAAAIVELASVQPSSSLTVSAVAHAAGISRDTFYRHATSPSALLAAVLDAELEHLPMPAEGGAREFGDAERELLEHVAKHAEIYRNALVHGTDDHVRDILELRIHSALTAYLHAHPQILPAELAGGDEPLNTEIAIAYAVHGTVGAIEAWLRSPELDTDAAARAIVAASPSWWVQPLR